MIYTNRMIYANTAVSLIPPQREGFNLRPVRIIAAGQTKK